MESIKNLVHDLLETETSHTPFLQRINESLLKNYKLSIGDYLTIVPKEVDIFYVNRKAKYPYVDTNMHCMIEPNSRDWGLQSNRFGQIYCHTKGFGGIDICLSDSDEYALCCSLKAGVVNGIEYWSAVRLFEAVMYCISEHKGIDPNAKNVLDITNRLNARDSINVLNPRENPFEGCVYSIPRTGLRRRDKNINLPLRSFMDIWNKKLAMKSSEKINLYMEAHPNEDVVEVMKSNGLNQIPYDIRVKYHIDSKVKLRY